MLTPKQPIADVAVWSLAAVGVAVAAVLLLVLAGVAPVDRGGGVSAPSASPAQPALAPPAEPPPTQEPVRVSTRTPRHATPPAPAPVRLTLTVTATRGDSWISARLGSETGRVLEERLLAQGESVRLSGRRIWLLVGASGNVDLLVNGKPRPLAPGTVETVFSPPAT